MTLKLASHAPLMLGVQLARAKAVLDSYNTCRCLARGEVISTTWRPIQLIVHSFLYTMCQVSRYKRYRMSGYVAGFDNIPAFWLLIWLSLNRFSYRIFKCKATLFQCLNLWNGCSIMFVECFLCLSSIWRYKFYNGLETNNTVFSVHYLNLNWFFSYIIKDYWYFLEI